MNTGKEPFKCGMESAECGVRPQFDFRLRKASCDESARPVAPAEFGMRNAEFQSETPHVVSYGFGLGERDRPGCRFRRRAENSFLKLNGSTNGSGATPEPARETRALPPVVHPKLDSGQEFPSVPRCGTRQVAHAEFGFQMVHARPHPGPLLRGEGEFFAALLKIRATGFADRSSAKLKTTGGFSFSWGRRWG